MTDRNKEKLIECVNSLNNTSKIDLYYFLKKMNIPRTENINGQFFLISDISEDDFVSIQNHINELMEFETRMNFCSENEDGSILTEQITVSNVKTYEYESPLEINRDVIEFFESHKNSLKRSLSNKYSVSKKKYNKMTNQESVKTDDTDLSELMHEEYILQ
jgi:hypothetical protein